MDIGVSPSDLGNGLLGLTVALLVWIRTTIQRWANSVDRRLDEQERKYYACQVELSSSYRRTADAERDHARVQEDLDDHERRLTVLEVRQESRP